MTKTGDSGWYQIVTSPGPHFVRGSSTVTSARRGRSCRASTGNGREPFGACLDQEGDHEWASAHAAERQRGRRRDRRPTGGRQAGACRTVPHADRARPAEEGQDRDRVRGYL